MGLFMQIKKVDEKLSKGVFATTQHNSLLKLLADICSFTSDEILWFGVPSTVACALFTLRLVGVLSGMGCIEELFWDMFGSCAVGTFVECMTKLVFRRTRPIYAKQADSYCLYGEWFSFPSGHTMRAFYWIFYLTESHFLKMLQHVLHFPSAVYFIPWACAVGWARVGKGRHYIGDCIIGGLMGSVLGYVVEAQFSAYHRAVAKTIGGIYTVACWGYYVVVPFFAGKKATSRSRLIVGVLFYAYALSVFRHTLPEDSAFAGFQTLIRADEGHTCTKLW